MRMNLRLRDCEDWIILLKWYFPAINYDILRTIQYLLLVSEGEVLQALHKELIELVLLIFSKDIL